MAFIYLTEHYELKLQNGQPRPIVSMPPIATQKFANDTTTTESAAFNANTNVVGVHSDSVCSIEFSATPGGTATATTSSRRFAANTTEYFDVRPGDKVAAILNT